MKTKSASHTRKTGRSGQVFTWDLIFSVVLFLIVFFIIIYLWDSTTADIRGDVRRYEMNWLSESVAEQLVRTPGYPADWNAKTVEVYGLTDVTRLGLRADSEDRIVDADKLLFFLMNIKDNYTDVRKSLLGSSRYDFFVILTCLNNSQADCMQGLHLDSVNIPVTCGNGFNFTVRNYATDTHIWLEAEDPGLWDHNTTTQCVRGCSGGFMSTVHDESGVVKNVSANPGAYTLWVRGFSNTMSLQISVDGVYKNVFEDERNVLEWSRVGDFLLGESVQLAFNYTNPSNLIDALLLTTNPFYDPRTENSDYYGNPNNILECIVGNYSEGGEATELVGGAKTASFSERMNDLTLLSGKQRLLKKTFKIKFMVWGGGGLPEAEPTTTATTLPPERIVHSCIGKPGMECVDGSNPVIVIDDLAVQAPLRCGRSVDVKISWHGNHHGDYNHWGFFLDDDLHFIDACNSTNGTPEQPGQAYYYDLYCTVNVPLDLEAADGFHELIVTGEDYLGYCPSMSGGLADAVYTQQVLVANCVDYERIGCSGSPKKSVTCAPGGTLDRIYWIDPEFEPITCNDVINVSVYWAGTHGGDEYAYWAFFLDNGTNYLFLDACETQHAEESSRSYYNATCAVSFSNPGLASLGGSEYRLVVTGESEVGYCDKISDAEVVDDRVIRWMPCA